jgi:hypothetical protein
MAMPSKLRNSVIAAVGGGAIAIASALITGPTGNDGLEGVRYKAYKDVVGVLTVCHGHLGTDIMLGKTYRPECERFLTKTLTASPARLTLTSNSRSPKRCVGRFTRSRITSALATSNFYTAAQNQPGRPERCV